MKKQVEKLEQFFSLCKTGYEKLACIESNKFWLTKIEYEATASGKLTDITGDAKKFDSYIEKIDRRKSVAQEIEQLLGIVGRMISGSKSRYRESYPTHLVVFNANLCFENGKVWYGDLDIDNDMEILKDISEKLKEPIYILSEMDGRFENEDDPRITDHIIKFLPNRSHEINPKWAEYDFMKKWINKQK